MQETERLVCVCVCVKNLIVYIWWESFVWYHSSWIFSHTLTTLSTLRKSHFCAHAHPNSIGLSSFLIKLFQIQTESAVISPRKMKRKHTHTHPQPPLPSSSQGMKRKEKNEKRNRKKERRWWREMYEGKRRDRTGVRTKSKEGEWGWKDIKYCTSNTHTLLNQSPEHVHRNTLENIICVCFGTSPPSFPKWIVKTNTLELKCFKNTGGMIVIF